MATIFSIVNIPKAQLKGTGFGHKPEYETEREVTLAIVAGELKFGTEQAYRAAIEYQKELKRQNAPKFFKKSASTPSRNNKYTHVMFQKLG